MFEIYWIAHLAAWTQAVFSRMTAHWCWSCGNMDSDKLLYKTWILFFWNHWFSEQNYSLQTYFWFFEKKKHKNISSKNNFVRKINGFKKVEIRVFFSNLSEILGFHVPTWPKSVSCWGAGTAGGNSFPNAKCLFLSGLPPVIALAWKVIPGVWTYITNFLG